VKSTAINIHMERSVVVTKPKTGSPLRVGICGPVWTSAVVADISA